MIDHMEPAPCRRRVLQRATPTSSGGYAPWYPAGKPEAMGLGMPREARAHERRATTDCRGETSGRRRGRGDKPPETATEGAAGGGDKP